MLHQEHRGEQQPRLLGDLELAHLGVCRGGGEHESARATINPCLQTMNDLPERMLVAPERIGRMELERPRRKRLGGKMTEEDLLLGADRILQARRSVGKLAGLPEAHRPGSLADGYRMQQVAAERWGDEVVGWKVGATSQEVQKLFAIGEPVYGPVFKESVFRSPARLKATAFQHLMLEVGIRIHLPREPAGAHGAIRASGRAGGRRCAVPAIEIISPRFKRLTVDHIPQLVADFCGNGAAVLGTPCRDWRFLDLVSHAVALVDRRRTSPARERCGGPGRPGERARVARQCAAARTGARSCRDNSS